MGARSTRAVTAGFDKRPQRGTWPSLLAWAFSVTSRQSGTLIFEGARAPYRAEASCCRIGLRSSERAIGLDIGQVCHRDLRCRLRGQFLPAPAASFGSGLRARARRLSGPTAITRSHGDALNLGMEMAIAASASVAATQSALPKTVNVRSRSANTAKYNTTRSAMRMQMRMRFVLLFCSTLTRARFRPSELSR